MNPEVRLENGKVYRLAPAWKRIAAAALNFGLAYALLQALLYCFPGNNDFHLVLLPMLAYMLLHTILMLLICIYFF